MSTHDDIGRHVLGDAISRRNPRKEGNNGQYNNLTRRNARLA